jgi:hypothetical protein
MPVPVPRVSNETLASWPRATRTALSPPWSSPPKQPSPKHVRSIFDELNLPEAPTSTSGARPSEHVGGIAARPKEYERRVVGFFDRELLGDG